MGYDEWDGKRLCLICANLRRLVHQPSDPIIIEGLSPVFRRVRF